MTKKELRKTYMDKRLQLSATDRNRMDDLLLIQFQQIAIGNINSLLTYAPLLAKNEVNVDLITDFLQFRLPELELSYPCIDAAANSMKAFVVNEHTPFTPNQYGIYEPIGEIETAPNTIDAVFVPLLCFDQKGYRVGYGKGYYDRFLTNCKKNILKIGFSYFEAEIQIEDIDTWDIPLNICITPNTIYEF